MKKFFIAIFILFVIILVALFIFMLTFDVNQYKALLIEKISQSIEKDVKIGNISLNFLPSFGMKMDGISIKDTNEGWEDAILEISSLEAYIKLLPLIKKDIQIERLHVRGMNINIEKGIISVQQKELEDDVEGVDIGVGTLGALKFLARSITVVDSTISYADHRSDLSVELDIIEAILKNISLYGPININARLSLFGRGMENIALRTVLYPELDKNSPYLKNLDLRVDLALVDVTDLLDALGEAGTSTQFIGKETRGELSIASEKMHIKKFYNSNVYVNLSDGMTDIISIKDAFRNVSLKAEMKKGNLIIQRFSGQLAEGSFLIKGIMKGVLSPQATDLEVVLENIDISMLLPDSALGEASFEGILDLNIKSSSRGLMPQKTLDAMTAEGNIRLDKPVLKNVNILEASLDKINILPGLVENLKARLPLRYKEILRQRHTAFNPIEVRFNMKDKKLFFEKTEVSSDGFSLVGKGYLDTDRNINLQSDLFIPEDLSGAFISVVRELEYLKNSQGMITMPLEITGRVPNISVRPDLDYVVQKLAVSKGQELLQDIIKKKFPSTKPDDSGTDTSKPKEESEIWEEPAKAILNTIFDSILTPQDTKTK